MSRMLVLVTGMSLGCTNEYTLLEQVVQEEEEDGTKGWAFTEVEGTMRAFVVGNRDWDCYYTWTFSGLESDAVCDQCLVTFDVDDTSADAEGDSGYCADVDRAWDWPFYMSIVAISGDVDPDSDEPCREENQLTIEEVAYDGYPDRLGYALIKQTDEDDCGSLGKVILTYHQRSEDLQGSFETNVESDRDRYSTIDLSGDFRAYTGKITL